MFVPLLVYLPVLAELDRSRGPIIPSAVDPPFGERAAVRGATCQRCLAFETAAGAQGGGLLGSPGSSADGMATILEPEAPPPEAPYRGLVAGGAPARIG